MAKKNNKINLKIVFDTNALHTVVAHDLLNNKTKKLIEENSNHRDVHISWYLPEVVILERQFQMLEAGRKLLPNIEKMQQLLGHNLMINDGVIKHRVDDCIKSQIDELKIVQQTLDTSKVNWQNIIVSATSRIAPFENNDKEKGFRDALILETFAQIADLPISEMKKCRIVLVTDDILLTKATNNRFIKPNNIKIIQNIEKCEEFISLLVNEVTEEYIKQVENKIELSFYNAPAKSGIYYDCEIRKEIEKRFSKQLKELYPTSSIRENGNLSIFSTSFSHKESQKFYWTTEIKIEGICYRKEILRKSQDSYLSNVYIPPNNNIFEINNSSIDKYLSSFGNLETSRNTYDIVNNRLVSDIPVEQKIRIATCKSTFEIKWSIVIKTNNVLGMSQLENIEFIENLWEEA